jgi:hypothetical protein
MMLQHVRRAVTAIAGEAIEAWPPRHFRREAINWCLAERHSQWDYPTDGKGDCEDYALMKRKLRDVIGSGKQAPIEGSRSGLLYTYV